MLLLLLLAIGLITTITLPQVRGLNWDPTGPHQAPTGPSLTYDLKVKFLDSAPTVGTVLKTDSRIRFSDSNFNNIWDTGETIVYDANNNSQYDNGERIIAGILPSSAALKTDPKIRFVDINFNNAWDPGEAVVYDANLNGIYDSSEPVMAARASPFQASETVDAHLKFVDSNANNIWDPGESMVYDSNNNGLYSATIDAHIKFVDLNSNNAWDAAEPVVYDANNNNLYDTGDIVIAGSPASGTTLRTDSRIKFVDTNRDGSWEQGEAVIYDSNSNSIFDSGEPVIASAAPSPQTSLATDGKIKFWDRNGNNLWDAGDSVVYDDFQKGYYNATIDPKVRFLDNNANGHWDVGEPVIYDKDNSGAYYFGDLVIAGTPPNLIDCPCALTNDVHFRFVDTYRDGLWVQGEAVTYETDSNNVYDSGETIVAGSVQPGTLLSEPVVAGSTPPVGTQLKVDSRIKFSDTNANGAWDPGDPVIYDNNNNNLYDTGEPLIVGTNPIVGTLLSEPVIAGPVPVVGATLKADPKAKFIDANANLRWDPGEVAAYDSNGNGKYDLSEPVISGAALTDGIWNPGEPVVYDANNNSSYDTGETLIVGATPTINSSLSTDPLIRFIDSNGNNQWNPGETVVYDSNNNDLYDSGESIVAGTPPAVKLAFAPSVAPDPLGRVWLVWNEKSPGAQNPNVFFRMWNSSNWTSKQQVTNDLNVNNFDFVAPLANQTMIILWSSNRTGHPQLFYRLYASGVTNPYPTTNPIQLTSNSMYDVSPSAVQDRNGRIWVAWARQNSAKTTSDIYYKYYNGTSWSADFSLPKGSSPSLFENSPSLTQTKDGRIWALFSSNDTANANLYYTTTTGTLSSLPPAGIPSGSWTTKTPILGSGDEDDRPSIVQSRDGTIWIFYQKSILSGAEYIYYGSSADNGATWTSPTSFSTGTDDSPSAAQMGDHKLWVFWNRQTATQQLMYIFSDQIAGIHDIGIRGLSSIPSLVESGDRFNITVTATNYGDFQENTVLTLKLNSTILTSINLSLSSGQSQLIFYSYQTVQPAWGRYTLTSSIPILVGENTINQGDNSMSIGPERVSPPGDVNRDGIDNILDVALVAYSFGSRPGSPTWNPVADINRDGVVDILDVAQVAFYYGRGV